MKNLIKTVFMPGAVFALFVLGVVGDLSAQRSASPGNDVDSKKEDARDAQGSAEKMTRKEKLAWVEEKVGEAYQVQSRVRSMLEQARKEKDSIKISCLADKLTQIEVDIQGIEDRRSAFDEALSSGDEANTEQQFTVLQIYISRVQNLMTEAEKCVGESDVVIGESETTVTVDEDITVEDPSDNTIIIIGIDQPIQMSGFY
jgi:hypothetical protein